MIVGLIVFAGVLGSLLAYTAVSAHLRAGDAMQMLTHGVGALGALEESLKATNQHFSRLITTLTEIQAPNALATRLTELETKMQGAQLTVADAVEKVTALANRTSARISRAKPADPLDDGEDEEITPAERETALRALGVTTTTADRGTGGPDGNRRAQGSGWDRVRRKKASTPGGE